MDPAENNKPKKKSKLDHPLIPREELCFVFEDNRPEDDHEYGRRVRRIVAAARRQLIKSVSRDKNIIEDARDIARQKAIAGTDDVVEVYFDVKIFPNAQNVVHHRTKMIRQRYVYRQLWATYQSHVDLGEDGNLSAGPQGPLTVSATKSKIPPEFVKEFFEK
jgi:hypothetical protein